MIGEKLKELRKLNNMSLRALSEISGISKSTLSDIENDKTNPTTNTIQKIAEAFNIDVEELFKTDSISYHYSENWNEKSNQSKEETALYGTGEFKTAEAAMQFILKQPAVMGYGGFNVENLTDKELIQFANELLNQLKLLGLKYKK